MTPARVGAEKSTRNAVVNQAREGDIMHDLGTLDLENVCREILNAFEGVVSWKWDSQFQTALAEFMVDNKDNVNAVLERYLSSNWDSTNIDNAPESVQVIISRFGGLRSGQLFFASDPNQDVFIFGVWWPWGDGDTISLRVAPSNKTLSDAESEELLALFKDWCGL